MKELLPLIRKLLPHIVFALGFRFSSMLFIFYQNVCDNNTEIKFGFSSY